jgi:hypothetical protein
MAPQAPKDPGSGSWLPSGIAVGVAIGAAMHNIGVGLGIGVALGAVMDYAKRRKDRSDKTGE